MFNTIKSKTILIFTVTTIGFFISLLFLFNQFFSQKRGHSNSELLLFQSQIIETVSRRILQISILQNAKTDQQFNISNLFLELEPHTQTLRQSVEIMKKGGILDYNNEKFIYEPIPGQYSDRVESIGLNVNALSFIRAKLLISQGAEKDEYLNLVTSIISQLLVKNKAIYRDLHKIDEKNTFMFQLTLIISCLIILSTFVIIMVFVYAYILKPLNFFSDSFIPMTEGNLSSILTENRKDEFGLLYKNFNKYIYKMKEIFGSLKDMGQILISSSFKMTDTMRGFSDNVQNQAATTEEISASIEEISAGVENVAKNAQDQNDSLIGLINKLNGLSNVITDMSLQIQNTMANVNTISNQAKAGNESLSGMNESMKKINASSGEVTGIIQIINDISDQINLLSLNAAIEAARAGDAGRGFAVVADEISKLADKTAASIKEIDRLIKGNESEIKKGMQNVESVVTMINTIVSGVSAISNQMNTIFQIMDDQLHRNELVTKDANTVQSLSEQIKSATDEQKTAFEEIVKSISVINQLTQSNADGTGAISINSENINKMTEELNRNINFFKIE